MIVCDVAIVIQPFFFFESEGYPVDSHELLWLRLEKDHEFDRCSECGGVFKLVYVGSESADGHHH
jgi:cytochrome c oxidase subunit 5b